MFCQLWGTVPVARREPESRTGGAPTELEPVGERSEPDGVDRPRWRRPIRDLVRGLACIVLLHVFVVQISVVRGHSMQPSLRDGDRLVVDRLSHHVSGIARFSVIVLRYPRDPNVDFVKRIVGIPGDTTLVSQVIEDSTRCRPNAR